MAQLCTRGRTVLGSTRVLDLSSGEDERREGLKDTSRGVEDDDV